MLTVTKRQLFAVLSDNMDDDEVLHAILDELDGCDIRTIYADAALDNLPADEVLSIVDGLLDAQCRGYLISAWCGDGGELLVVGYRADELTIVEEVSDGIR